VTRLLIAAILLAGGILVFFAALADADGQAIFLAQTSLVLFVVIVGVVLVTSLITSLYIFFFNRLGEGLARRRLHRFLGWKLLRSQRRTTTFWSALRLSWHRVRDQGRGRSVAMLGVGLLAIISTALLARPATWNTVAEGVSPTFALALRACLLLVGGLLIIYGIVGLSARRGLEAPRPVLRERSAVTLPTFISIVGVSIGIWALVVVLGVMHGLQSDLREKILRTNAHLLVEPRDAHGVIPDGLALEDAVRSLPGVVEAHAFVHGEVMVSSPTNIAVNVVVKGMTLDALETSEQLAGRIEDGGVEWLRRPEALIPDRLRYPPGLHMDGAPPRPPKPPPAPDEPVIFDGDEPVIFDGDEPVIFDGDEPVIFGGDEPVIYDGDEPIFLELGDGWRAGGALLPSRTPVHPGILIGAELARNLGVSVGVEIQLISPDGEVGPTGLRPKLRSYRVAGIFRTGMYEYDQKLAYTTIDEAMRFFDYSPDINRLEARIERAEATGAVMAALEGVLATHFPDLRASDWRERNRTLFSALQLERIVMLIILGFIVLVAALLIVSSLVMLVVEKVKEIAVLKALGASDWSIVRAFMVIGSFIGIFGALAGFPLGIGTCLVIMAQGFTLPREFYITELPVKLDPVEVIIIGLVSLAICLLATLYPSYQASRLRPADGLRHG